MKIKLKRLALATASVGILTIYGCGGGGGTATTTTSLSGSNTTTSPTSGGGTPVVDPTNSTKVTPSLGKFSAGTLVNLTKPDATPLSSGTVGADGSVTLTYPATYTGPIVVTVMGGLGVTYFDEKTGTNQTFDVGSTLRAILPSPQVQAGVTALTNAAVENLVAAGGIASASATTVNEANAKVAAVFGMTDILVAPTPVSASTGQTLDLASPNDKYALILAAFAQAAPSGTSAATFAVTLALDLKDGKLDAKNGTAPLSNSMSAESMLSAYQTAANSYATDDSKKLAAAAPMTITKDVTLVKPVTNQSDVILVKALFSELRTTLNSFSNNKATGFLDTKASMISDDINANVAPELSKVSNRIKALENAMMMFEDAKSYTNSNTNGLTVGTDPTNVSKLVLLRSSGSLFGAWNGYFSYASCWTDAREPSAITKVTCSVAGTDSADRINNKLKLTQFVLTSTANNQYSYSAIRFNKPVTFTTSLYNPTFGTNEALPLVPQGSGSSSKTLSGNTITSMTFNGTLPPSIFTTGADTIAISATRTALTGNNIRYALSGSVSTINLSNANKVVSLSLDSGTYFDVDETDANNTMLTTAKLVGTAQTAASKFTGTFDVGTVQKDSKGVNAMPTAMAFTGVISDLSTNGAGEFLTGKLEAAITNYNAFDSNAGKSPANFMTGTVAFTGTVQAPARPQLKLVLAGTVTSLTTSTMTLNYSYGTGISITGSGSIDSTDSSKNTMTLSNQAGIQLIVKQNAPADVTKAGVKLATINDNLINYIDGVSESF